jgi:hypothetical protein
LLNLLREPGPADLRAGIEQRRRRLEKNQRLGGHFVPQFFGVRHVVAPHADDLGGQHRRQQLGVRQRDGVNALRCRVLVGNARVRIGFEDARDQFPPRGPFGFDERELRGVVDEHPAVFHFV